MTVQVGTICPNCDHHFMVEFATDAEPVIIGDMTLDLQAGTLRDPEGQIIHTTAKDWRLLARLAATIDRMVPYDTLLRDVYGMGYAGERQYLRVNVSRLRRLGFGPYIEMFSGRGYMLSSTKVSEREDESAT